VALDAKGNHDASLLGGRPVPHSETQPRPDAPELEVLTLPDVAAYLRVPEKAVLELVAKDAIPGQQIGGEWRFLKRAVVEWLRFGPHFPREFWKFPPPWMLPHPFWEDLLHVLEQRILSTISAPERPSAKPGSKQAVLRHFGVFQNDADVEEQLAGIRARREAAEE
jgi:excisionase family DNA binding protein